MAVMSAVGWIGVMFLLGALIRAKIKPIGNMMIPSCLIGGVIGCILMNTCGVGFDVTMTEFSTISSQMYNFLFINMGVTVAVAGTQKEKKEKARSLRDIRRQMGEGPLSGIIGMGSYWMVGYCLQGIVAFVILYFIGGIWDMDPVYGLMLPFAYAQGPGQAISFGTPIEASGWAGAIQVGIMFSAVGFVIAFLLGVPFAKKGIKNGIPCSKAELSDELKVGFFPPEKQESYGKITVFGGNLDTMTFHLAVTGAAWILGKVFCIFLDKIPLGTLQLGTTIFFFWGMLAGMLIRFIMGKLGLTKYLDRGTQVRITNSATDLMVLATFMSIDLQFLAKWLIPILIICVVGCIVTWVTIRYFGARFGGSNDFERTLAEWGTVTGTNATGLALARIVDPNNDTTTAAELGASNATNLPGTMVTAPAIIGFAAGAMGPGALLGTLVLIMVAYLVFMRLTNAWGKKTYDLNKGEKYRDGKCYQRFGKAVDE